MKFSGPLPQSRSKWLTTAGGGEGGTNSSPTAFWSSFADLRGMAAEETFVLHKGWNSDLGRLTKTNLNGFRFKVWICDLNYHKIRRTLALNFYENYLCIERLYQTLERVFHQISKDWEVGLKDEAQSSFFNPLLSFWISDEKLFLMFDILRQIKSYYLPVGPLWCKMDACTSYNRRFVLKT